jgi:hypothetical protein
MPSPQFTRRREVREKPADVDPDERLSSFATTAMVEIRKDAGNYRPDRCVANAITPPIVKDSTLEAKGGAFRSRGKWCSLSFSCAATPNDACQWSRSNTQSARKFRKQNGRRMACGIEDVTAYPHF